MKLFLFILLNFTFVNKAVSQNIIDITLEVGRKKKITKVDVQGDFSSDTTRRERITKKLSTSKFVAKGAKKGTYIVRVIYVVSKDGSIADIKCQNDPGYGLCQESIRAIKVSESWRPAGLKERMQSKALLQCL